MHAPEWIPVIERPMITISGDATSRLKPMKPPARRTRRALRLRAPFLAGTSSRELLQSHPTSGPPWPLVGHPYLP